jgi:hypothetical protein
MSLETALKQGRLEEARWMLDAGCWMLDDLERAVGEHAAGLGGVLHPDYCGAHAGPIKWLRAHGVRIHAVAPIVVDEFVRWCEDRAEDPEWAGARYAAGCLPLGVGSSGLLAGTIHVGACWCMLVRTGTSDVQALSDRVAPVARTN